MAKRTTHSDPIRFGHGFVQSEAFRVMFQEGMALVADTAAYLDGPGREESRRLPRPVMAAYAAESMRLTARLMQIAAWLLAQRAEAEGDLSPSQAKRERARLRRSAPAASSAAPGEFGLLPEGLRALVGLAARFHARMLHIDLLLSDTEAADAGTAAPADAGNPVAAQRRLLERAFVGGAEG